MKGLSIVEVLVALAIALIVAAAGAWTLAVAVEAVDWQPTTGELSARADAVTHALTADLAAAGAGPLAAFEAADPSAVAPEPALAAWLPAVLPRVLALDGGDPDTTALEDRVSLVAIADGAPQARARPAGPGAVQLLAGPTCAAPNDGCGLRVPAPVLVLPRAPGFTLAETATRAADLVTLAGNPALPDDALVAEGEVVSYRFDPARGELLRGRAAGRGLPLVDHVAAFAVELWADAAAPVAPRWAAAGESCVTLADGSPRLRPLDPAGGPVRLEPALLRDGPWCGTPPFRFDADLFRVRRVRIHVRLQAGAATARGRDRRRFAAPGLALRPGQEVADVDLAVDVAPAALRGPS